MSYSQASADMRRANGLRTGSIRADTSPLDTSERAAAIAGQWAQALQGWRYDDTLDDTWSEGEA